MADVCVLLTQPRAPPLYSHLFAEDSTLRKIICSGRTEAGHRFLQSVSGTVSKVEPRKNMLFFCFLGE